MSDKPEIKIIWLYDTSDCETCGPSYANGALVFIDGVKRIDLTPAAHCYSGDHYDQETVYAALLAELGFAVTAEDSYSLDELPHVHPEL